MTERLRRVDALGAHPLFLRDTQLEDASEHPPACKGDSDRGEENGQKCLTNLIGHPEVPCDYRHNASEQKYDEGPHYGDQH